MCSALRALTSVTEGRAETREGLEATVGYGSLRETISSVCPTNTTILQEALNMVRERGREGERGGGREGGREGGGREGGREEGERERGREGGGRREGGREGGGREGGREEGGGREGGREEGGKGCQWVSKKVREEECRECWMQWWLSLSPGGGGGVPVPGQHSLHIQHLCPGHAAALAACPLQADEGVVCRAAV